MAGVDLYGPGGVTRDQIWEFIAALQRSIEALEAGGGGGGGDHPDVDHATLTTVIAGLAAELALLMDRQTYHPGLSPSTAVDSADPASYDGAQVVSTFEWTHLRSIVEISQYQAVQQMRCQILLHEATDTADVLIMDPCMRAVG